MVKYYRNVKFLNDTVAKAGRETFELKDTVIIGGYTSYGTIIKSWVSSKGLPFYYNKKDNSLNFDNNASYSEPKVAKETKVNFTVNKDSLKKSLELAKKNTSKDSENVKLLLNSDVLVIQTYANRCYLEHTMVVTGNGDGEVVVNIGDFINDLKAIPLKGDVNIEFGDRLVITLGKYKTDLIAKKDFYDFNEFKDCSDATSFSVNTKSLLKAVEATEPCIKKDNYYYCSFLSAEDGELTLMATNAAILGHAIIDRLDPIPEDFDVVIRPEFTSLLKHYANDTIATISVYNDFIKISFGEFVFYSELKSGIEKINYKKVMPETSQKLEFKQNELLDGLKFIEKKVPTRTKGFKLIAKDGNVALQADNKDKGLSRIDILSNANVEDYEAMFNIDFVTDVANVIDSKIVKVSYDLDQSKPIIVNGEKLFWLIMPFS